MRDRIASARAQLKQARDCIEAAIDRIDNPQNYEADERLSAAAHEANMAHAYASRAYSDLIGACRDSEEEG